MRVDLPVLMQNTHLLRKPCPSNVTWWKTDWGGKVGLREVVLKQTWTSNCLDHSFSAVDTQKKNRKISGEQRDLREGTEKAALQEAKTYRASVLINIKRK